MVEKREREIKKKGTFYASIHIGAQWKRPHNSTRSAWKRCLLNKCIELLSGIYKLVQHFFKCCILKIFFLNLFFSFFVDIDR